MKKPRCQRFFLFLQMLDAAKAAISGFLLQYQNQPNGKKYITLFVLWPQPR